MSRHVAVIVPGGTGKNRNIPSLVQLLHRLSISYTLHLYSFAAEELHPLLAARGIVCRVPPRRFQQHKLLMMGYLIYRMLRDHRAHAFSLLHSFWAVPSGLTAMAANFFLNLPTVLSLPGGDTVRIPFIHYGSMKSAVFRSLIRRCCRSADQVVLLTRYQEALTQQRGTTLAHARIIPFGVDLSQFAFLPRQIAPPLRLISIGSVNRVKNVFLQVETLALLAKRTDVRLTIVGKDVLGGQVRAFAESMNIAELIEWKGQTPHDEIPSLLHASHVMLHTAWFEAEGVAIMEAFAAGTVVVGPRVGLLAETDAAGACTVALHDASALAEKILALARDPQLVRRVQQQNRSFAEQHTIERTAAEYQALYEEMTGPVAGPASAPVAEESAARPG